MQRISKDVPERNLMSVFFAAAVYVTPYFGNHDGHFPVYYYCMIMLIYCAHQVTAYAIFVSQMAFHAQISDPNVGGTYMSLLNTMANLGANWPITMALSVVDNFTWKYCTGDLAATSCTKDQQCSPGQCMTYFDGYYALIIGGIIVGVLWKKYVAKYVEDLHGIPKRDWSCQSAS
ncbi:unnamed protein product [Soboliphyme baturini]|uniref:Inorganic phosphate cotransporter n=1 Tax=Soboliphyme baturini TaxID=241478 RepID=A0A183I9B5_9BILA|nr:unnamed protein product [Soboliphyme baturini]